MLTRNHLSKKIWRSQKINGFSMKIIEHYFLKRKKYIPFEGFLNYNLPSLIICKLQLKLFNKHLGFFTV